MPFDGVERDALPRRDTSLEKLAKLPPAFDAVHGSLTAGNSSPLTDGAASLWVADREGLARLGVEPTVKLVDWELAAVDFLSGDEGMLMAPARAIARLLGRHRLAFGDVASWNVHEAFAAQVVANLRLAATADYRKSKAGVDADLGAFPWERVNPHGRLDRDRPSVRGHRRAYSEPGGQRAGRDAEWRARNRFAVCRWRAGYGCPCSNAFEHGHHQRACEPISNGANRLRARWRHFRIAITSAKAGIGWRLHAKPRIASCEGEVTDALATTVPGSSATAIFNPADLPLARKYLIFGIMAFGQFMALIDIQIVAASLNDVQAGLSAGPDEISWVQTGYLMAELVMIPFSAFLAQAMSTRWLFALSAGLFTLASALCGMAWDIDSMVAFRVIQGFVGGAMIPTVFATGFALFTGKERAMIPAIPRHDLGARADPGPDRRRLAHRCRRLAFDLLRQHRFPASS